jgi:integrase/recombinase XerD
MTTLAATLQAFFTDRLVRQRQASPHTIAAYRDTFRLLLRFTEARTGKAPCSLDLEDLDAPLVMAFLEHVEVQRGNSARTRNARLAAVRSLFRYAAVHHPQAAAVIQRVLAIPQKRYDKAVVSFLTPLEVDALLAAPDLSTWEGRRDRAMLLVAIQAGLRVSELVQLTCSDVHFGVGAHVTCFGKGRKHRVTPLTRQTAAVLRTWLRERAGAPGDPLFPTRTGGRLSRDAVERRVAKHSGVACSRCPSLTGKHLSPHVLRHTSAMQLLHAGIDTSVIALWLGHEDVRATQMYLHADLATKEQALARTAPADAKPGRYRPSDRLLAFLETL